MRCLSTRGDFVARSMAEMATALERAVFSEEMARLPGLLQQIDPRAKLMASMLLLLAVGSAHSIFTVLAIYIFILLLGRCSHLPLLSFNRRVWLGVPLFAGFVVLPSLFILPGEPLLVVLDSPPLRLAVTDNGLASATLLTARVGTSVSIALLLIATTRWTDLMRALKLLRIPDSFLLMLAMTHRYLFLFLRAANGLFIARASRTVGATSTSEQRRWAASAAGVLVSRSVKLSGDVLLAMRARGFDGEVRNAISSKMVDRDRLSIALALIFSAGVLLVDRLVT